MLSSYYFRDRIPPELRAEIDRANADRAAIIHRALGRLTDGAIVVTEAVIAAVQRLRAARQRRRAEIGAIRELSALSDRQLRDIGLVHGQIREAVRHMHDAEPARPGGAATGAPDLRVIRGRGPERIELPEDLRACA